MYYKGEDLDREQRDTALTHI